MHSARDALERVRIFRTEHGAESQAITCDRRATTPVVLRTSQAMGGFADTTQSNLFAYEPFAWRNRGHEPGDSGLWPL